MKHDKWQMDDKYIMALILANDGWGFFPVENLYPVAGFKDAAQTLTSWEEAATDYISVHK